MNKLIKLVWVFVSVAITACSFAPEKSDERGDLIPAKILKAQGTSRLQKSPHLSEKENQFALEQVATINAYRALAQQLYKEKLTSGLLVGDQVIKAEPFRVYVDLYLRQASIVKSTQIYDQKRIDLALPLTPRFYQCTSSTVAKVSQCLREDDKIQFTRIGYQQAPVTTVNLSCYDCSSQLSVSGFSKEKNVVEKVMLEAGLYDASWFTNMGANVLLRYWFLTNSVFN